MCVCVFVEERRHYSLTGPLSRSASFNKKEEADPESWGVPERGKNIWNKQKSRCFFLVPRGDFFIFFSLSTQRPRLGSADEEVACGLCVNPKMSDTNHNTLLFGRPLTHPWVSTQIRLTVNPRRDMQCGAWWWFWRCLHLKLSFYKDSLWFWFHFAACWETRSVMCRLAAMVLLMPQNYAINYDLFTKRINFSNKITIEDSIKVNV